MMLSGVIVPPDDKPSVYIYKVCSSGLADFSRLRNISTGINPRADTIPAESSRRKICKDWEFELWNKK